MTSNVRKRLRTPRAAAAAGIIFALLLGTVYVLLRLSIPTDPSDSAWLDERSGYVRLALGLVPFAGIAFLWFMGVVRDRIGDREDRFFSTVYSGSGLLFLAMGFVSAAAAGSLLATYGSVGQGILDNGIYTYGRDVVYRISNVYAMRMAAVFMFSLGTVGFRTKVTPTWLNIITYGLAASLLIVIGFSVWISLVFPAWVLIISIYFLITNLQADSQSEVPATSR
ncbi:MAG: hypothetical protein WAL25_07640 [Acidimicrobiia bacterium]